MRNRLLGTASLSDHSLCGNRAVPRLCETLHVLMADGIVLCVKSPLLGFRVQPAGELGQIALSGTRR